MATEVTQSEFARRLNCSPAYISKLKDQGRLVFSANGKKVLLEASLERLEATADPSKEGVKLRWQSKRADASPVPRAAHEPTTAENKDQEFIPDGEGYDYQRARAKRETHLAAIAEMDERQRRGELLEADDVSRALTDYATASRVALEQIADRLCGPLAAISDSETIYQMIRDEVERVIDNIREVAEALPAALGEAKQ